MKITIVLGGYFILVTLVSCSIWIILILIRLLILLVLLLTFLIFTRLRWGIVFMARILLLIIFILWIWGCWWSTTLIVILMRGPCTWGRRVTWASVLILPLWWILTSSTSRFRSYSIVLLAALLIFEGIWILWILLLWIFSILLRCRLHNGWRNWLLLCHLIILECAVILVGRVFMGWLTILRFLIGFWFWVIGNCYISLWFLFSFL